MNNPDAYAMIGECPICKVEVGLSCSKKQALGGELVEVYSITCNHTFTLTKDQSEKLRHHLEKTGESPTH
jgi:hypothetical protein